MTDIQHNQIAWAILARLEAATPGLPVSNEALCEAAGCDLRLMRQHLPAVRKYVEENYSQKLCNRRGYGYWLSASTTDEMDECLKECMRSVSHLCRMKKTLRDIVSPDSVVEEDDREIRAFCDLLAQSVSDEARDKMDTLLKTRRAKLRERIAKEEVKAPGLDGAA